MKKIILIIIMLSLILFIVGAVEISLVKDKPQFTVHKIVDEGKEILKFEIHEELTAQEIITEAMKIKEAGKK